MQLLVARSISESWTQQELYRRLKEVVGLSPRDAQAVQNLRDGLRAQKVPPSAVDKRAQAYANRLLRKRARTIALTERRMVLEHAKVDMWAAQQEDGRLSPGAMRKTQAKAGCCDFCRREDQKTHPLNDPTHLPPFHPNCRCESVLVGTNTPWEDVRVDVTKNRPLSAIEKVRSRLGLSKRAPKISPIVIPEDVMEGPTKDYLKTLKRGDSIDIREYVRTPEGQHETNTAYVKYLGVEKKNDRWCVKYKRWGDETVYHAPLRRVMIPKKDTPIQEDFSG